MAGLQRFVTYIYRYEDRQKKENAGFAKIEIRGTICRIEIHVRNGNIRQQESQVYLFAEKEDHIQKIQLGMIGIMRGSGTVSFVHSEEDFLQNGIRVEQLCGIGIYQGETMQLSSFWKDVDAKKQERIYNGKQTEQNRQEEKSQPTEQMQSAEKSQSTDQKQREGQKHPEGKSRSAERSQPAEQQTQQTENPEMAWHNVLQNQRKQKQQLQKEDRQNKDCQNKDRQNKDGQENAAALPKETQKETIHATELTGRDEQKSAQSGWDDFFEKLKEKLPVCYPFEEDEDQMECFRMELKNLRELPSKYWYLGNNSFLLHGFFNYRHFLIGKMKTGQGEMCFIGVPGVFQNQERIMAAMFGFPEFRTAQRNEYKTGNYGYWYRIL